MTKKTHQLTTEFVVINAKQRASVETRDADLYARLDRNYDNFKGCQLVSCHRFDGDWPSWEIHPHGDEVVILMSGRVTFVLRLQDGDEEVRLENQGDYALVPADVWHTAKTNTPTAVIFITPGEETGHSERPEKG